MTVHQKLPGEAFSPPTQTDPLSKLRHLTLEPFALSLGETIQLLLIFRKQYQAQGLIDPVLFKLELCLEILAPSLLKTMIMDFMNVPEVIAQLTSEYLAETSEYNSVKSSVKM